MFNEEDYNEFEEFHNRMNEKKRDIDFAMLKQTLKRGNSMPLTVEQFVELFGEIRDDDFHYLTQQFIQVIHGIEDDEWTHILGMDNPTKLQKDEMKAWIVDGWGEDWIKEILMWNQDKEEYENCSTIWDALKQYSNIENFVNNGVN